MHRSFEITSRKPSTEVLERLSRFGADWRDSRIPSTLQAAGLRDCRLTVGRSTFELRLANPMERRDPRHFGWFRARGTMIDTPNQGTRFDVRVDQTPFSRAFITFWIISPLMFLLFSWGRADFGTVLGMSLLFEALAWTVGRFHFVASLRANTEMMKALIHHVLNDDGEQGVSRTIQAVDSTDILMRSKSRKLPWRRWVAWLIAVPFGTAVVIHLLTYVHIRISEDVGASIMFGLFSTMFLAFIAAIIAIQFDKPLPEAIPKTATDSHGNPWGVYIGCGLPIYVAINFLACGQLMEWAGPARTATGYILESHGRFIRSLTETEYWRMRAYELRLATGHPMLFLGWSMAYFFSADSRPMKAAANTH